jgi:phage baseplate assembly protein W
MSKDLLLLSYLDGKEAFGKNDLVLDYSAGLKTLSNIDKLKQDILKILITERGTNSEDENYGSLLGQQLLGKKQTLATLYASIKREVLTTIKYYQELNEDNEDPDERISEVKSLEVTKLDPRSYEISVVLITESGKDIGVSGTIGGLSA